MTTPRGVLWSVPLLLVLHNGEEALTMPHYLPVVRERAPEELRPLVAAVSYPVFLWALALATMVPLALTMWADGRPAAAGAR